MKLNNNFDKNQINCWNPVFGVKKIGGFKFGSVLGNPYGHIGGLKIGHAFGKPFLKGGGFTVLAPNPNADDSDENGEIRFDEDLAAAPPSDPNYNWDSTV